MLTDIFNSLSAGQDIKESLSKLKQELSALSATDSIPSTITDNYSVLSELLHHDDPKIRKNAALVLGMIHCENALDELYQGYISDETLYNKAAYLKAIGSLDFSSYTDRLFERRTELINCTPSVENKKHILEELHELNMLLVPYFKAHTFTGISAVNECVLLTNRNFKQITMNELHNIPHKEFTAGVMVKTKQLEYVLNNVRTYSELLFVPDKIKMCSSDPLIAARELTDADLCGFIFERLDNSDSPLLFRVDDRSKDTKASADFAKRLGLELELLSCGRLVNSTDNYELELRFIDTSGDRKIILVRFCSLKDKRFSYRKNSIAVSIKPYLAALFMQLSAKYLKNNAAVLDPFCGTGTMLIERDRFSPIRICYGIDIFAEAIQSAEQNISAAGLASKTELIKKDFFEFRHDYKFDEIITDMPFATNAKSLADIEAVYRNFFKSVGTFCEKDAHMFIYSRNRDFLRKYALASNFKILEEFEISKVEKSYFFILSAK